MSSKNNQKHKQKRFRNIFLGRIHLWIPFCQYPSYVFKHVLRYSFLIEDKVFIFFVKIDLYSRAKPSHSVGI